MLLSPNSLKWVLRIYPPLLFQRIWVLSITENFRSATVKVKKSLFTRNYNRSIFGGTIYSAADPFYPAILHQLLTKQGFRVQIWLRAASVKYIKPALRDLFFDVAITDESLMQMKQNLELKGRHSQHFKIEMLDSDGVLHAIIHGEVYIRNTGLTGTNTNFTNESDHE